MKMFLRILFSITITVPLLSSKPQKAESPVFKMAEPRLSVETVRGFMVWDGHKWIAEDSTEVKGFVELDFLIDDQQINVLTKITGIKDSLGSTFFLCENAETFYQMGSPKGLAYAPFSTGTFLDPAQPVPVITSEELDNFPRLSTIVELVQSEDPVLRRKGAWDIWKYRVNRSVEALIEMLTSGGIEEKLEAADKLGFIYHPYVCPALAEAAQEPDDSLREAAEKAIFRRGCRLAKGDSN